MRRAASFIASLAVAITVFCGPAASAPPIVYAASGDGPLPSSFVPGATDGPSLADFLTLDVGTNVFSGSAVTGSASTFDTAPVILPADLSITAVTVTVTPTQGGV